MSAVFLGSYFANQELPGGKEPRIAFLGRSNVGKSTLINRLAGAKIARVSKAPGRTRALNLFRIQDRWIFGDFPGYGFAKVSRAEKAQFELLAEYFLNSRNFSYAIQIVDARHPAMKTDLYLQEWLRSCNIPYTLVLNKSDKLNQKQRSEAKKTVQEIFPDRPVVFSSSLSNEGKKELQHILHKLS